MVPLEELDRADIPGNEGDIRLLRRGAEFSIRTGGKELMNSRLHASEDMLAALTCSRLMRKDGRQLLLGGLGMGFTLAAALAHCQPDARVTVSELIPAVVRWNRDYLGPLAGNPLEDPRVSVIEEDVADTIANSASRWDAILLDVDNGPNGLTRKANNRLYGRAGLEKAFAALRQGGILAVWSCGADAAFTRRLKQSGFQAEAVTVRAHETGKGGRHVIWLARRGGD